MNFHNINKHRLAYDLFFEIFENKVKFHSPNRNFKLDWQYYSVARTVHEHKYKFLLISTFVLNNFSCAVESSTMRLFCWSSFKMLLGTYGIISYYYSWSLLDSFPLQKNKLKFSWSNIIPRKSFYLNLKHHQSLYLKYLSTEFSKLYIFLPKIGEIGPRFSLCFFKIIINLFWKRWRIFCTIFLCLFDFSISAMRQQWKYKHRRARNDKLINLLVSDTQWKVSIFYNHWQFKIITSCFWPLLIGYT